MSQFAWSLTQPSSLLTALVGYWRLEESSGTRIDQGPNALGLTATNTPGNATGKIGDAVSLNGTNQYLSRANEALIQSGGKDITIAGWAFRDADSNGQIVSKDAAGQQEWDMQCYNGGTQFVAYVAGAPKIALHASHPVTTWFFFVGQWNATTNIGSCNVNNGTPVSTAAQAADTTSGTAALQFGCRFNGALEFFDGLIDEVGLWMSAPGGGGLLSATQLTALYNGGTGRTYPFIGAA